jgi:tRNA threonylcarbamoyladenosine biosynthesis protein TsaE
MKLPDRIVCPPDFSTAKCGYRLLNRLPRGALVLLEGPTGVGKTEFVRGFLRALDFPGRVNSPTFVTLQVYEGNDWRVFHGDMDRLPETREDPEFVETLLLDRERSWSFVEWGDKLPETIRSLFPVVLHLRMEWEEDDLRILTPILEKGGDREWVSQWQSDCRECLPGD